MAINNQGRIFFENPQLLIRSGAYNLIRRFVDFSQI